MMPKKLSVMGSKKLVVEQMEITPELATRLLEANKYNRPLSDAHVKRIARQIAEGKWMLNGDTIKIANTGDVLDGQHRLWAVIEANRAIETLVVRGPDKDVFSTIDTLRKSRSASDMIFLKGATHHRHIAASALQWLVRYERDVLTDWKSPQNRVENSDVEHAFEQHPLIIRAAEKVQALGYLGNRGLLAFLYYVIADKSEDVANKLIDVLVDASIAGVDDPMFLFRNYLITKTKQAKDPINTIALAFKAANAKHRRRKLQALVWRRQGVMPEPFPALEIKE